MQGVFIHGRRPVSKKAVKQALIDKPDNVSIEATSFFGNEFDGIATSMAIGSKVHFVGPDPYTKRNFYGTITRKPDGTFRVE